jgi:hypothetical protein
MPAVISSDSNSLEKLRRSIASRAGVVAMILFAWFYAQTATAGTWSALAHRTPVPSGSANGNPTLMLLLSDGTVMVENDPTGGGTGTNWFRLTPDIHGSYANGTWTILTPSTYGRGGCASDVMTNGRVFFAGGEYGTGSNTVEVFDPVSNAWTIVPVPISLLNTNTTQEFSDAISVVVANGDVLVAPVKGAYSHETMLFHPALNSFTAGPNLKSTYQDEASWVKLPDNSILTIDPFGTNSERYIPSLNLWVTDAHVPVALYDGIGELGAGFLLPDGRAFFLGGTGHTAFYTPSGITNQGVWAAGPDIPAIGTNVQGCPDAPAAMMANGNILVSTGVAGTFSGPIYFFESLEHLHEDRRADRRDQLQRRAVLYEDARFAGRFGALELGKSPDVRVQTDRRAGDVRKTCDQQYCAQRGRLVPPRRRRLERHFRRSGLRR